MGFRAYISRTCFYPIPTFGALSVIIIFAGDHSHWVGHERGFDNGKQVTTPEALVATCHLSVYAQNSASMVSRNLRLENEELRRQLAAVRWRGGEGEPIGSLQPVTMTGLEGLETVIEVWGWGWGWVG